MQLKLNAKLAAATAGLLLAVGFAACKKTAGNEPGGHRTALSDEDSLKYLMYNIMQVSIVDGGRDSSYSLPSYFWYAAVPKLNALSSSYATADDLLGAIKTYPINTALGKPYDKYSFLDRDGSLTNALQNGVSGIVPTETTGDYGMEVNYALDQNNQSHLVVEYADKNAAAGKAGIQRGWEITAVNGDDNIAYDGPGFGNGSGANVTKVSNAIYSSSAVSLTLRTPAGASTTVSLSTTAYDINPVLYDTVYNFNGQKVGYFVFYTFPNIYNTNGAATNTKTVLDQTFQKFAAAGIRNLIVDLRYNGGGSVSTAEYLDSAIAPAATRGQLMYTYTYNDKMTQFESDLKLASKVNFPGGGSLNLQNVFFIVSGSTASASELTLNNLKPYMRVKLVGDTTFGKPVGFLDFTISDHDSTGKEKYLADLYAINFATTNASGTGGYYNGIAPDVLADDFINVPWGDALHDDNLQQIFTYLATGSFGGRIATGAHTTDSNARLLLKQARLTPNNKFNGMIDYRLSQQLKTAAQKK